MSPEIKTKMEEFFDFILTATEENDKGKIYVKTKRRKSLQEWYMTLDHYENEEGEGRSGYLPALFQFSAESAFDADQHPYPVFLISLMPKCLGENRKTAEWWEYRWRKIIIAFS